MDFSQHFQCETCFAWLVSLVNLLADLFDVFTLFMYKKLHHWCWISRKRSHTSITKVTLCFRGLYLCPLSSNEGHNSKLPPKVICQLTGRSAFTQLKALQPVHWSVLSQFCPNVWMSVLRMYYEQYPTLYWLHLAGPVTQCWFSQDVLLKVTLHEY